MIWCYIRHRAFKHSMACCFSFSRLPSQEFLWNSRLCQILWQSERERWNLSLKGLPARWLQNQPSVVWYLHSVVWYFVTWTCNLRHILAKYHTTAGPMLKNTGRRLRARHNPYPEVVVWYLPAVVWYFVPWTCNLPYILPNYHTTAGQMLKQNHKAPRTSPSSSVSVGCSMRFAPCSMRIRRLDPQFTVDSCQISHYSGS